MRAWHSRKASKAAPNGDYRITSAGARQYLVTIMKMNDFRSCIKKQLIFTCFPFVGSKLG